MFRTQLKVRGAVLKNVQFVQQLCTELSNVMLNCHQSVIICKMKEQYVIKT